MSKEELRILNHAKKLLNPADTKSTNNRQKKRVSIQSVPSTESLPVVVEPKVSPVDSEKLIHICANLHKSTFDFKPSQEIDVKKSNNHTYTHTLYLCISFRKSQIFAGRKQMNLVKKVSCNAFNSACKCLGMTNYRSKNVHIYLN